jgi:hypothetical protein
VTGTWQLGLELLDRGGDGIVCQQIRWLTKTGLDEASCQRSAHLTGPDKANFQFWFPHQRLDL